MGPREVVAGVLDALERRVERARSRIVRVGYGLSYRLTGLNYAIGVATPKATAAGNYWSYELRNSHGDDEGLATLAALPPDSVVLDIGAHVGEYAIPLTVHGHEVYAFEPNPKSADRFEHNCRRNGIEVALSRIGLGDSAGERRFFRSTFPKLSAFDRGAATRWGAGIEETERRTVRRVDGLVGEAIPPPDGMKIDVEGAEFAVLRGATATVERHCPLIVLEHHADAPGVGSRNELRAWLQNREYGIEEQGDVWLCRPDSSRC